MEGGNKIYVVLAISLIILTGLIIYLITIEKKITNLEKKINQKNKKQL